jgi:hypothetical protein
LHNHLCHGHQSGEKIIWTNKQTSINILKYLVFNTSDNILLFDNNVFNTDHKFNVESTIPCFHTVWTHTDFLSEFQHSWFLSHISDQFVDKHTSIWYTLKCLFKILINYWYALRQLFFDCWRVKLLYGTDIKYFLSKSMIINWSISVD